MPGCRGDIRAGTEVFSWFSLMCGEKAANHTRNRSAGRPSVAAAFSDEPSGGDMGRRIRRPEYVPQMEITDCGAACLAMSLTLFGIRTPLRELRSATGAGRRGVTRAPIIPAGRQPRLEA